MEIFGLGLCQVAITGAVIFAAAWMLGFDWRASLAAGAGLALSSTAFAIQILRERGDLATPYGDRSFAILLFQDLAIVPILALIAFIAPAAGESHDPTWLAMLKAVGAISAVVLAGRYGLKPLFHFIALTKADEVFTAAALLVVVASALAMDAAGLSMAMGAFIAGVLLADTEFRHQLETDIEPFRGPVDGAVLHRRRHERRYWLGAGQRLRRDRGGVVPDRSQSGDFVRVGARSRLEKTATRCGLPRCSARAASLAS